jgi:hypothetical protein
MMDSTIYYLIIGGLATLIANNIIVFITNGIIVKGNYESKDEEISFLREKLDKEEIERQEEDIKYLKLEKELLGSCLEKEEKEVFLIRDSNFEIKHIKLNKDKLGKILSMFKEEEQPNEPINK